MSNKKYSVIELFNKYNIKPDHMKEVAKISEKNFDFLNIYVDNFTKEEKKYLIVASLLHDIGYFINSINHNKYSFQIIFQELSNKEFNKEEVLIIANIARYHRGSLPSKSKHIEYSNLSLNSKKIVDKMSAILKVADGISNTEFIDKANIKFEYDSFNEILTIILPLENQCRKPSIYCLLKKKDLFEKVYESQIVFKFQ